MRVEVVCPQKDRFVDGCPIDQRARLVGQVSSIPSLVRPLITNLDEGLKPVLEPESPTCGRIPDDANRGVPGCSDCFGDDFAVEDRLLTSRLPCW